MTETSRRRGDITRQRLVVAASRQFARCCYTMTSLDDILAEGEPAKAG